MARSASFKTLIAYEAFERFAGLIRSQEMAKREAAQLESQFDTERGFEKSDRPGHPHMREQAAESRKIVNSQE